MNGSSQTAAKAHLGQNALPSGLLVNLFNSWRTHRGFWLCCEDTLIDGFFELGDDFGAY